MEIFSVDWTGQTPPHIPRKSLPRHVAVVMDGNGRWANQRNLPRIEGHKAGESALIDVVAGAVQVGVPYLSLYVFSTENWLRAPDEVRFLLRFTRDVIARRRELFAHWGVRVRWSGVPNRLGKVLVKELRDTEEITKKNTAMNLNVCLNYGSRQEIVNAIKSIVSDVNSGLISAKSVNEKIISRRMYMPDFPDVDLFLRSSGENRMSNFMLWQSAYAELIFMSKLWPDFRRDDFWAALRAYSGRSRRFGR
ncbi:isoprenyl transferase [Tropheryma whipplei]|uniref:Isoprenyl transferase 1 n=2 Tax=Tropheryma whipplei TaxID=2039 RepID=ISPT1_TROWT|nr:isoprenyl transferase [Tropheryma whipplei]Q83GJ0.1 RecName: Full=Isoprenyl transferase 1 [Tropheryma whipplei str. Twist]Q83HN8.1 RecName: Full=Isoprenyl transferase 2 [Tropheryma whipplei TW08/27]AAO44383.1 undecaprenyl pyrophosphate synthetase [Tropheryma whipplei str. Twist]MCO8182646.1 isoprenyl transferase [Tropheryma whipplei]MCO8190221.1 isoprenyl transferase [Tropheryma whipplei]CAD67153.1 undecaprenyl pyrophosphate synthetase [Tropheryma whipplei TW08/27]